MASLITVRQPNTTMIAAGHNNAANLRGLEGFMPPGDSRAFVPIRSWGNFDPGDAQIDGTGLDAYDGYPFTSWLLGFVTPTQDAWLSDTYCSGGRAGYVTIRTQTSRSGTHTNFNAVLRLPKLVNSEYISSGRNIRNYRPMFTRLVAI